jgi:chromosomal replication initiation ATPase DnaA
MFRQLLTFLRGGEMDGDHSLGTIGAHASAWDYGPRVTFSVTKAMHARLLGLARTQGVSVAQVLRRLVTRQLTGMEPVPEVTVIASPAPVEAEAGAIGDTPRALLAKACATAGISVEDAKSPVKTRVLSMARWHVMAILSDAGYSSTRIGRLLGNRDHTTVLYGIGRWRELTRELAA